MAYGGGIMWTMMENPIGSSNLERFSIWYFFLFLKCIIFLISYMWPFSGLLTEQDKWKGGTYILDSINIDTTSLGYIFHCCTFWTKIKVVGRYLGINNKTRNYDFAIFLSYSSFIISHISIYFFKTLKFDIN